MSFPPPSSPKYLMIGGRGLLFLAGFCWDFSLFMLYRNRGVLGLVYLFLCIIPLCVATSSFLALDCIWGRLGVVAACLSVSPPLLRLYSPLLSCLFSATLMQPLFWSFFLDTFYGSFL